MGNLNVSANGYKSYSNTVALQPGNNFAEITLQSNAPTPVATVPPGQRQPGAAASPAGATAPLPQSVPARAAITFQKPPPNFIRRKSEVILHAKQ
jgi:hypothetical protein